MSLIIHDLRKLIYTLVIINRWRRWNNAAKENAFLYHLNLMNDKDTVKQMIMTYAYGAGESLRIPTIIENIITKARRNGVIRIKKDELNYTATILSNYFGV
jgi:hypothetical protein